MPSAAATAYSLWLRGNEKGVRPPHRRQPLRHRHPRRLVDVPSATPAISKAWGDKSRWRTLLEGEWRFPEEHINIKEARVALLSLRRASRQRPVIGRRLLTFSDNLVTCTVADKGRSRSCALNAICRRGAAYQLGLGIRWRVRYVETDRNHADLGSRRRQLQEAAWARHRGWRGLPAKPQDGARALVLSDLVRPPGLPPLLVPPPWASPTAPPVATDTPVVLDGKAEWASSSTGRPTVAATYRSSTSSTATSAPTPSPSSSSTPPAPSPSATPSSTRRALVANSVPELRAALGVAGKEPVILELFAGTARLQKACERAGPRAGPAFEIALGPQFGLSRKETQLCVLNLLRSQRVWYVHMGTPCTIWSISRTTPKDRPRTRQKERLGVTLAIFSARIAKESLRDRGILWSIDNPRSSRLWSFPRWPHWPLSRLSCGFTGSCAATVRRG